MTDGALSLLLPAGVFEGKQPVHAVSAGAKEVHAIAAALRRLPAHSIWKVSEAELASAGGPAALNLSSNVKVAHGPAPPQI